MIGNAISVLLEHLENFLLIEDVLGLGLIDGVLGPAIKLIAGQPVAHRYWETQLLAVQNMRRDDLLHGLAQGVFGGAVRDLQVIRDGLGNLEDFLVQEWHAQLQGVGHIDLIGLDQDVTAHPSE